MTYDFKDDTSKRKSHVSFEIFFIAPPLQESLRIVTRQLNIQNDVIITDTIRTGELSIRYYHYNYNIFLALMLPLISLILNI